MLTGSVTWINEYFFSLFLFVCPFTQSSSSPIHLFFLIVFPYCVVFLFFLTSPLCLPLCFPFFLLPEMDMGLPDEGDSINALCSQINSSFTKPSDELFSNPSMVANGPPTCTVPPVLPPPPAPMQGKKDRIRSIVILTFFKLWTTTVRKLLHFLNILLYLSSHFYLGAARAYTQLSSWNFCSDADADAERAQAHTLWGREMAGGSLQGCQGSTDPSPRPSYPQHPWTTVYIKPSNVQSGRHISCPSVHHPHVPWDHV